MSIKNQLNPISWILKLSAAITKWSEMVAFYLALVFILSFINQLLVFIYRDLLHFSDAGWSGILLTGTWIPGLANIVAIVLVVSGRAFVGYFMAVAVLTYLLSIAYYYMAELSAIYNHDPTGGVGIVFVWMIAWFLGGVMGVILRVILEWKSTR